MRIRPGTLLASSLTLGLVLTLGTGCTEDPQDPKTWIKKLNDPRDQKEAIRQLARLKDESAFEPLAALFKRSHNPEHLDAIKKLRTDKAVDLFAEQLDFSEENYEAASVAATGLSEIAERDDKGRAATGKAVDALAKAVTKDTSIRSRANVVRFEAIKALGATRDPRAVEPLNKVLEVSADKQDFLLNKEAAKQLAQLADKRSVPSLVRGLFMTGRGKDLFPECRLGLVRIGGQETIDALAAAMARKNTALEADAKEYKFFPGIIVQKTSYVMGDLRDKRAVPALLQELAKKDEGLSAPEGVSGHQSVIIALGQIADPSALKPLLAILGDAKRPAKHRAAAAEALNAMGATEAVPVLTAMAKIPYFTVKDMTIDSDKAMMAVTGGTGLSRLAETDVTAVLEPIAKAAPDNTDAKVAFQNAVLRAQVVKECGKDVDCYAKNLDNPASARAERAALSLGRMGRAALGPLTKAVAASDTAARSAALLALSRVGTKADTAVIKALTDQIEIDRGKGPRMAGIVDDMKVTLALIEKR